MNNLKKLQNQIQQQVLLVLAGVNILVVLAVLILIYFLKLHILIVAALALIAVAASSFLAARWAARFSTEPIEKLSQAIVHVLPEHQGSPAPDLDHLKVGRELVTTMALQVYQLGSSSQTKSAPKPTQTDNRSQSVLNNLPMPVIVLDQNQVVIYANTSTAACLQLPINEVIGKDMYSLFDLAFPNDQTFDSWLTQCRKDKLTATMNWERVRLQTAGQKVRHQFDMVAYYNKNNPNNVETIIGLFDQTEKYKQDDSGVGFIALAVHELRTPLTMLRGYIEVLEEELRGKLDPELNGYLQKMQVASQQLANFVTNILNVARVEENQLFLQLKEEKWDSLLRDTLKEMSLRAQVHHKQIVLQVQPDLPNVAVDPITITEVIINLVDNAIKYSGSGNKIIVKTYMNNEGFVETTVQDFGVGIPTNALGNLFEKFYRSYHSKSHVGGTGLGLYLSKSIVGAHNGQIWVKSKEGEGSTFGFTLVPYAKLAEDLKKPDNNDVTRIAHGWIKNHSFYRR